MGVHGPGRPSALSALRLSRARGRRAYAQWLPARMQLHEPTRELSRSGACNDLARPRRKRRAAESGTRRKPGVRGACRRSLRQLRGAAPRTRTGEMHREVSYTPPILVIHDGGSPPGDPNAYFADVAWRMPVDDYNTYSFILKFYPFKDGQSTIRPARTSPKPPPLMRGTHVKFDMTTINGQDAAAQIGQ